MALPLLVSPQKPYAVAGMPLPTQPGIKTCPESQTQRIFAGATFTLLFFSPDTTTQAILASGATVSLQFALSDGSMVTAPVLIAATLTGSVYQVDCTILSTQVLYRWVVVVQAV